MPFVKKESGGRFVPADNRARAGEVLYLAPSSNASPETMDAINNTLGVDGVEFATSQAYYNTRDGTNYPPIMVEAIQEFEYGKGASAKTANHHNKRAEDVVKTKWSDIGKALPANLMDGFADIVGMFDIATGGGREITKAPVPRLVKEGGKTKIVYDEPEVVGVTEGLGGMWQRHLRGKLKPDVLKRAQDEVRKTSPSDENFIKLGVTGLSENLFTIAAYTLSPWVGAMSMFSREKYGLKESLINDGVAPEIAEIASTTYGMASTPIEFVEFRGRIGSAFGKGKGGFASAIKSKLSQAGINVGQELTQKFFEDVIYNAAIEEHNRVSGENIKQRPLFDSNGDTIKASLALSAIMEAIGLSYKGGKKAISLGDANRIRKQNTDEQIDAMVEAGEITVEDADAIKMEPTNPDKAKAVDEANKAKFERAEEVVADEANESIGFGATEEQFQQEADRLGIDFDGMQERFEEPPVPMFSADGRSVTFVVDEGQTVEGKLKTQRADQEKKRQEAKEKPVDDFIGFSTEKINEARVERGEEELSEVEVKAHQESMQNALDKGLNQSAEALAERVIGSEESGKVHQMSDEEVAGMGARLVELRNERVQILRDHRKASESGDQEAIDDATMRLVQNHQRADLLEGAIKTSATASGRANSMMASMINRFTYDVANLVDQARVGKGAELSPDEVLSLQDVAKRIEETELKIADLKEQIKTGKFKETKKRTTKTEPKELSDLKVTLHQLQREARNKIYDIRKKSARDWLKEFATLPRSLMATADMSYGLRQGLLPSFGHPLIAGDAWGKAFESFFSQNTADEIDLQIREHPLYDEIVRYGIHFSSLDSAIEDRTEFFASNLAEKIPAFGKVVMASERNMVTGINSLRLGLMVDYLNKHPDADLKTKQTYAKYINAATGRGDAAVLNKAAEELSLLFFAPRFAYSRIQAPAMAINMLRNPELRGEIIRQWSAYLGTGATILTMAALAGYDVGLDPDDSDWGKISDGKVHIDIFGGVQQPMRVLAKSIKGGYDYRKEGETDADIIADMGNFLKYKLSPPIHMIREFQTGEDIIGREIEEIEIAGYDLPKDATTVIRNITPLVIQSAVEAYNEGLDPLVIAGLATGEGLGLSIQVYEK